MLFQMLCLLSIGIMNKRMNINKIETISVLSVSLIIGVFVAYQWDNSLVEQVSSAMYTLFLPGILAIITIGSGFHGSNEAHIVLGVVVQFLLLWLLAKYLYIKIKSNN